MAMALRKRTLIFLIIVCLIISPFILLSSIKNRQKGVATDQFLFAVINDVGPKKDHFQILAYTVIDNRKKEMLAIIVPEDTKLEMPGTGFNRLRHAYYFKDFSLASRSIAKFIGIGTSASDHKGHYMAVNAKILAKLIDDTGGIKTQGGMVVDGKAAVEELKKASRQRNPVTYGTVIYTLYKKPSKFAGRLGQVITFKGSTTKDTTRTASNSVSAKRGRLIHRISFGLIGQEAATKAINRAANSMSRINRAAGKSIDQLAGLLPFKDNPMPKDHGTNLNERDFKKTLALIRSLRKTTVAVLPGTERNSNDIFYWAPEKTILTNLRGTVAGDGLAAGIRYVAEQKQPASDEIARTKEDTETGLRP